MAVAFCFRTDVVCSWNQESCCLLMLILLMLVAVQSGGWALGKDDGWLGHDLKLRMLPACVLFLVHGLCLRCFTRSMLHAEAFFLQPSWLRGFRGLVQVMCSWSPHEILMLCLFGLLYSPSLICHVHLRAMRPVMSCSASELQPHVWFCS